METYIRHGFHSQNIPFYDCSVANKSSEDWIDSGTKNPLLGGAFLLYGAVVEVIYTLVMCVLWRIRKGNACYKIMFVLGCFDMLAVGVNSLTSGVLWIMGASFCVAPDLIYVVGCLGLSLWCGACLICLILVLNRLCDLWAKDLVYKVFGARRIRFWLLLPILYSLYFFFFTPPILFNSSAGAWFFSPMIVNTIEETKMFYNIPHTVNNLFVVVATGVLYVLVCAIVSHKYGFKGIGSIENLQKSIAFQAVVICLPNLIASFVYVFMQFVHTPSWVVIVGHISWQCGHGVPAIVYLFLNKRIRRGVADLLGMRTTRVRYLQRQHTQTTTSSNNVDA